MDENLEWLTQNTEDPKSNKRKLTFTTHTVNVIELKSNKKLAPPISTSTPPFQVYPHFLAKNFISPPLVTQFPEGSITPLIRKGSNCVGILYFLQFFSSRRHRVSM